MHKQSLWKLLIDYVTVPSLIVAFVALLSACGTLGAAWATINSKADDLDQRITKVEVTREVRYEKIMGSLNSLSIGMAKLQSDIEAIRDRLNRR